MRIFAENRVRQALEELAEAEKRPATQDDLANYCEAQFIDGKFILDELSKAALDKAVHSLHSAKGAVWNASQSRAAYSREGVEIPKNELEELEGIECRAYQLIADQALYLAEMGVKGGSQIGDVELNRDIDDAKNAASNSGMSIDERLYEIRGCCPL